MTEVITAILLLYNIWLVFLLLHDRRNGSRTDRNGQGDKHPDLDAGIVGRSLFRMPEGRTSGDTAVPQAATSAEGEALAVEEVTFAPGNIRQTSVQIPDDRLDEAFSDTRLSDVPVEYADGDSDTPGEYASGATIEEMNEAIRTAGNPEAAVHERMKAGEVLHEMEGNGLYDALTSKTPGMVRRIRELIDLYESRQSVPVAVERKTAPADRQETVPGMGSLDDFDISDFV